jgi:ArsR family transcriptional regulator
MYQCILQAMASLEKMLKALADPARLSIIEHLARPEAECCSKEDRVCACDLEKLVGLSQPSVSHHMKVLTAAELVSTERDGRWTYYRLRRSRFAQLAAYLSPFVQSAKTAASAGTAASRRKAA